MRSHGVPNFPDPGSNGGIDTRGVALDPASPQFQAADKACRSLLPQGRPPSQRDRAQILKYAQCMREHGIADFPDPNSDGVIGTGVKPGSDLAPNDPRFQAADKACKQYRPDGPGGGA